MEYSLYLKKAKNNLIKNYLILLQLSITCYIVANFYIVKNIQAVILLSFLFLFIVLIIWFNLYIKKQIQYLTICILIMMVHYFCRNPILIYCNLFYINIALLVVFIFDFKDDIYKICSLFLFISVCIFLNIFTNIFRISAKLSPEQNTIFFSISLLIFILFFFINIFFIKKKRNIIDEYINTIEQNNIQFNTSINSDTIDNVNIEEIDLLKINLIEDHKGFLNHFQVLFPIFYAKIKNLENVNISDLELLSLLKLNYTTKEIAQITNSTIKAIESKKYRLRKKFDIPTTEDLYIWVDKL